MGSDIYLNKNFYDYMFSENYFQRISKILWAIRRPLVTLLRAFISGVEVYPLLSNLSTSEPPPLKRHVLYG